MKEKLTAAALSAALLLGTPVSAAAAGLDPPAPPSDPEAMADQLMGINDLANAMISQALQGLDTQDSVFWGEIPGSPVPGTSGTSVSAAAAGSQHNPLGDSSAAQSGQNQTATGTEVTENTETASAVETLPGPAQAPAAGSDTSPLPGSELIPGGGAIPAAPQSPEENNTPADDGAQTPGYDTQAAAPEEAEEPPAEPGEPVEAETASAAESGETDAAQQSLPDVTPPPADSSAVEKLSELYPPVQGDAPIDERAAKLGDGAYLRQATFWTGSNYRTEQYLTLNPYGSLRPIVASADPLTKATPLTELAASLEASKGLHVAAGINGGYFTMSNGIPVGVIVRDGMLRSDDEGLSAIGFRTDGSAIIGQPQIQMTLTSELGSVDVSTLNRTRGEGLALFTSDFAAATNAAGFGWNLVCVPEGGIPINGSVRLTVEELVSSDGPMAIPAGRVVLSGVDEGGTAPFWMTMLNPGETLTLQTSCAPGWENVDSAVCLLYTLLENGEPVEGLETYPAPRTAVGIRPDGGLVFYTVDGRQSGYSVGSGLDGVARRMRELGCVTAGALDGGASTQLRAALPGDNELSEINRPSAGTARTVIDYIFLVTDSQPTGTASRLALYPMEIDALAGADIPLTVKAADSNGFAAPVPAEVTIGVTEGLGTLRGNALHAAGAGSGYVTVSAPGVEPAAIPLNVYDVPEEIALYGEVYGKQTESLTLTPGQEVDLTVQALVNHTVLESRDEDFTWELDPAAGTVDATGHLTASLASGSGTLRVSRGDVSRSIPIRISSGIPFTDVPVTHPQFNAVKYVYDNHIFEGTGDDIFEPETVMTRGMLVTVLWRMNGEPEAQNWPSFADVSEEDWFGPAVAWGVEQGLLTGYSSSAFGPSDPLTKEQILTILWRFAGQPAAVPTGFDDAGDVSPYAEVPVAWALSPENALTDRDGDGRLFPKAQMTRALVADVLMRYLTSEAFQETLNP